MTTLNWIRGVNGTLGHLAPEHVAGKMRRAFMTPRNLPPRQWELPLLASAERITLRFGLSALRWGKGPAVLLMHGWEAPDPVCCLDRHVGAGRAHGGLAGRAGSWSVPR